MNGGAPIPFSVPDLDEADEAAVLRALRSGWITTGQECLDLEAELAAHLDVPHVVAVSSCTAALEIAVAHLRLPPGARVGVPTWTFAASAIPAVHQGAVPVLLDVDPDTLNLDPAVLEAVLPTLDAVVGVHFGGVAMDPRIRTLCRDAGVALVEDAAHALGTRDDRGLVSGRGTAGACFSFYATKNLTSAEGGALATDDADLADFARSHRLHGLSKDAWARYLPGGAPGYDIVEPGIKANLPDVLAALARSQLARFDSSQSRRRELVTRYRQALRGIDGLGTIPATPVATSADHLMVVVLPEGTVRADVARQLADVGVATSIHFRPLHTLTWFAEHADLGTRGFPVADRLADRVVSLPLHTRLADDDVDRVCAELGRILGP